MAKGVRPKKLWVLEMERGGYFLRYDCPPVKYAMRAAVFEGIDAARREAKIVSEIWGERVTPVTQI